MPSVEEYALDMERRSRRNYAAAKDAQIMPSVVECVEGTGHIAIHTMNLLHLDLGSRRLL